MASSSSGSEIVFLVLAVLAAACFVALVAFQALEWRYYIDQKAPYGNVMPETALPAPAPK